MLLLKPLYRLFSVLVFITGILYPFLSYTLHSCLKPFARLQHQPFAQIALPSPRHYFQARASSIDWQPERIVISAGPAFRRRVTQHKQNPIEQELNSPSASGLDPLITEQAAFYQGAGLHKHWSLSLGAVRDLIKQASVADSQGIVWVSVPKLNLALERAARYSVGNNTSD